METAIEVTDLVKTYGTTRAVDGVSFAVEAGECFGILGPNGAGKTTLIECVEGLRVPDRGRVQVLALDPRRDRRALYRRMGVQLQHSALPERLKVSEAVALFSCAYPAVRATQELLEEWGLADKRNTAFEDLSGGQRQRLFLVLALLHAPEVVVLDELSAGLDPVARRDTWELVRRICRQGVTVLLVTHFPDEAEYLCDRVALVEGGRVAALDTPAALVSRQGQRVTFRVGDDLGWLRGELGVTDVQQHGDRVEVTGDGPLLATVTGALLARGLVPADLSAQRPTLEDVLVARREPEVAR